MPGVWGIDLHMAVEGSVHYVRQNVPIQFWVMVNNHVQDVQDRFPEKMAWARTHYRVENLTHRKLLATLALCRFRSAADCRSRDLRLPGRRTA